MHTACIILCKIDGLFQFDFIPNRARKKLRELSEKAIINQETNIKCFL